MADKKKRNKIKIGSFISPIGTAKFPHLNTPDTKWNENGEYRCPLIYSPEVAETLRPKLEQFLEKAFEVMKAEQYGDAPNTAKAKKCAKLPIPLKEETDKDGEETGNFFITPKKVASGIDKKTGEPWKKTLQVFDSKGKKLLPVPSVWGGSKLRADIDVFAYFAAKDNAIGVTLGLAGVQVIELVSGSGERESEFGEVEGGYVGEDSDGFGRGEDASEEAEDDGKGAADF